MGLNVVTGQLTQPGATGNQTINLPANFDPKAIILFASIATANNGVGAATDRHYFSVGAGTYRGSTVQQAWAGSTATNSDATSTNLGHGNGADALLKALDIGGGATDMEIDLVSMQTGATSNVVINWVNLHTTASVLVNYIIFGGSDISDAVVTAPNAPGATPSDFTVTGFGQPDLIFFFNAWEAAGTSVSSNAHISMGWGNKAGEACELNYTSIEATTVNSARKQRTGAGVIHQSNTSLAVDYEGTMAASGSWPTDGVRLTWAPNNATDMIGMLWLKGSFQSKIGQSSNPTAGTPPVAQDLGLSFTPTALITHTSSAPASTTIDAAITDGPSMSMGASDGTTELQALSIDDDANTSQRWRDRTSSGKVVEMATDNGGTLTVVAAADFVGGASNQVSWTTINATARAYLWVALASAAASGHTVTANTATETDAAQAVLQNPKRRLVGVASHANTAVALLAKKIKAITAATETDTAVAIANKRKLKAISAATETDSAAAVSARKSKAVSTATSTEQALAITVVQGSPGQTVSISAALETDTATGITHAKARLIGVASDAESALTITHAKSRAVGTATHTNTAVGLLARKAQTIGIASQTNVAQAIGHSRAKAATFASETDTALTINKGGAKFIPVTLAGETDAAIVLGTVRKTKAIGTASQANTAIAVLARKTKAVAFASDTNTALPITRKAVVVTALEFDSALSITLPTAAQSRTALDRRQRYRRAEGKIYV